MNNNSNESWGVGGGMKGGKRDPVFLERRNFVIKEKEIKRNWDKEDKERIQKS